MLMSITGREVMDLSELRARRMIAQLLAQSAAHPLQLFDAQVFTDPQSKVHAAARWMTASQAQLRKSGVRALAVRAQEPDEEVSRAVDSGAIVRSWSQRGTHHLLAAEDVRWVTQLCSPRVQRDSEKRQPSLGFTEGQVDTARQALISQLSTLDAHRGLSRTECYEVFRSAGIDPGQQRGPHLLRHFGGEGVIIQGPPTGATLNEDTFLLHDSLPHTPLELAGDEALGALATRYISARGPVTPQDFAWWAWLTVRDAKRGFDIALAYGEVETCEVTPSSTQLAPTERAIKAKSGQTSAPKPTTMYLGAWQAGVVEEEIRDALRQELRLPAFDEYLIAYKDRSYIIDPSLTPKVGPTRNGMCRPFIVQAGEITARATE